MKNVQLLFVILSFIGCSEGYHYTADVTFYAPKSKVEVRIVSEGFVPQGDDFGTGAGKAMLTFKEHYTDTLYLQTSPENIDTISYQHKKIPFKCTQMNKEAFFNFLDSVGYKGLDRNEIMELRDAITLINYGPKASVTENQTQYIKITAANRAVD
ncbi:hypothetical protein [Ulvibacter litoralis]|uniref:Lipoprotein n=1 Tax=Ulvibacter litoralis TaxID=227084 RepID=A0A1G7FKD6_9FLAO|nr:hypothetical protein [Ulvibacter litoralis]GHC50770.1 hypothetical protein GCM10008083_12960 [Ulvibacter litoralis]SDE76391.1 hypothetical protein SAMN05421855_102612 [Ulvibacter litoralis]